MVHTPLIPAFNSNIWILDRLAFNYVLYIDSGHNMTIPVVSTEMKKKNNFVLLMIVT